MFKLTEINNLQDEIIKKEIDIIDKLPKSYIESARNKERIGNLRELLRKN